MILKAKQFRSAHAASFDAFLEEAVVRKELAVSAQYHKTPLNRVAGAIPLVFLLVRKVLPLNTFK